MKTHHDNQIYNLGNYITETILVGWVLTKEEGTSLVGDTGNIMSSIPILFQLEVAAENPGKEV